MSSKCGFHVCVERDSYATTWFWSWLENHMLILEYNLFLIIYVYFRVDDLLV